MKVELQELEPCVKKITIEVPVEKVDEEKSAVFRELSKTATAPGFRRGHVPLRMLEKMYSKSVLGDVAQRLIQDAYREAIESNNLRPAGDPMVDIISMEDSQPLTFTATFEVFPDVEVGDISSISLKRKIRKTGDEEIDKIVGHYQEKQARFEPVEGRGVEEGDYVFIDYSATRDGADVENFKGENRQILVSKDNMLGGFHTGIIGMSKGEEKEFNSTLPREFPDPEMAGAELRFKVKVNELKTKVLPEADDQFAKEISEFDTMEEFRADIRDALDKRNKSEADNTLREDLLTKLIEANPFDLAPGLVSRQADALAERTESNLKNQGVDLAQAGIDSEALKSKSMEDAKRMLKEQVILAAYGKAEGIEVTDEDINGEIERIAGLMGQHADMVKKQLAESGGVSGVAHQAFTDKVYAAMMGKIKIEDEIVDEADEK